MYLGTLTYIITTTIMVMHSLSKTSTQHCYNKNYKTLIGVYMTLSLQKVIRSSEMDMETMPHAMYITGNRDAVTKINHVPYQTIEYDDKGMFQA